MAAPFSTPIRIEDSDRVAADKLAFDAYDPDRQQAAPFEQRLGGTGIDVDLAGKVERSHNPALAGLSA